MWLVWLLKRRCMEEFKCQQIQSFLCHPLLGLSSGPMKRTKATQSYALESLRLKIVRAAERHPRQEEPAWERCVAPLGLSESARQALITSLRQLWLLPFADTAAMTDLLRFRYTRLPGVQEKAEASGDSKTSKLCSLLEVLVDMALQGNSVFPQNPAHIAQQVQQALETPAQKQGIFDVLLGLLVSADGKCDAGFNFARVRNLEDIVQYEHRRRSGSPEWCWKAPHKYDLFAAEVKGHEEFNRDWKLLVENFRLGQYRDPQGIIRRSPLVEGNWRRPDFSDLSHEDNRFQIAFDFFCWKWFLYGMQGDEPMAQKLAVTVTPFGTQIFIPGFWSLDPVRDINWAKVTRLHRARGISRQGEKLVENRKAHRKLVGKIHAADRAARRKGLRGEARYAAIKGAAGLSPNTDNSEIRHYLRLGKNPS